VRAAVLRSFGAPLVVEEVPDPQPDTDEVLVRVRAAGLCGTDLKVISGVLSDVTPPLIPGHEIAGEVVTGGNGLSAGQRVACYHYDPCGECRYCRAGDHSLCPTSRQLGFHRDGGLAEFVRVRRCNLVPFGDALPFERAAVSMDAVVTPWHALHRRARLKVGERVVISGAGGLGLNGIAIARCAGARVAAIDPSAAHREASLGMGAELAVTNGESEVIREWANGGVDLALEASGQRAGFDDAIFALRPGGRIICCGYSPGVEFGLDSRRLAGEEIAVLGSRAGTRDDAKEALAAVERGDVCPPVASRFSLEGVNEALASLAVGDVIGRIVIEP
jgi:D-arabinose 1-dehydrogenase-like Zn-dependent alcohol dehydrogenase